MKSRLLNQDVKLNIAMPIYTRKGGAGIAALRLHKGLLKEGVRSIIFEKEKNFKSTKFIQHDETNCPNSALSDYNNSVNIHERNTIFTITPSCTKLSNYDFLLDFEIINLHWIANYLPTEAIAYLSHMHRPIVWTFHDVNPLSGGCHYFHGCESWKRDCMNCPQMINNYNNLPAKILASKKRYINFKNITVVVLNQHFKKLVEESPLFNESRIEVIPNSIDTDIYKPIGKLQARKNLHLDKNKKYIFYIAAYDSKIKGYEEFEKTISVYNEKYGSKNTEILLAGNLPKKRELKLSYIDFGHVDEYKLIDLYNASDVTVVSSIEDNLPNVILESLSCGTPVVGFEIGGLPDIIENGYNGYIVKPGDIKGLAETIHKILNGPTLSNNCRSYALKNLRLDIQAKRYKSLYEELHSKPTKATGLAKNIPDIFPETAPIIIKILHDAIGEKTSDSWYRFGKMSTKRKIWTVVKVISKKMKIYSILKYCIDITRNTLTGIKRRRAAEWIRLLLLQ